MPEVQALALTCGQRVTVACVAGCTLTNACSCGCAGRDGEEEASSSSSCKQRAHPAAHDGERVG